MGGMMSEGRIKILFHPNDEALNPWAVEKDEGGTKRRYLEGVTSGLDIDGHGERMTERCIKSFQSQAERGDILLFAGNHGSSYTEDIGMLVHSEIMADGQWLTRYRLYDSLDGMGSQTLESADKVWKQINGLPPYTASQKRGFSIEGDIPEGGLKYADQSGRRVMDDIELDGVWLVRRPSYRSSVAHAVAKAIGVPIPGKVRHSLEASLQSKMEEAEARSAYFDSYYRLNDATDCEVRRIMSEGAPDKLDQLSALYEEYGAMMIRLITENEGIFTDESDGDTSGAIGVYKAQSQWGQDLAPRLRVLKDRLEKLVKVYK
jgi:hypothetical protein